MTQKIKIEAIQLEKTLTAQDTKPDKVYQIVKITNSVDWEIGQNLTRTNVRDILRLYGLGTNSNVEIVIRKPKNSDFN